MKCKYCEAELAEGGSFCPACGKDNSDTPAAEQAAPAREKLSAGKIALLVVLAVAAVGIVIALVMSGMNGSNDSLSSTDPIGGTTGETIAATEGTIPADGNPDDVTCKGSYTVTDEEAVAARDTVVATLGDAQLTNGQLQIYYWMQFYDFMDVYGSYASMLGLDYTQPMDTQLSADGTSTWQQYFLASALSSWQNYEAMCQKAQAEGYEMDQEYADYLAALTETLDANAATYGFESAADMISADMGPGADVASYVEYMNDYYLGYLYYSSCLEEIQLTDAEVEAYFDENAETYSANGVEKDDSVYVDVRHILLTPEGGTTDESGNVTYSEAEWEACRAAAQAVLDEYLAGELTEERFAELANTYSTDPGSNTVGGLYTDVYEGQMVEPFENWCFDAVRQTGDTGLVQTDYGYHVMYFVGSESVWYATAWQDLMTTRGNELVESILGEYTLEVDYSAIVLGNVDLVSAS